MQPNATCLQCGTPFYTSQAPSRAATGRGKYCSRACKALGTPAGPGRPPTSAIERFWAKVDKNAPGGCWLWTGAVAPRGLPYGKFVPEPRGPKPWPRVQAHRFSWELVNGLVPDGLCVLHNCPTGDNPRCVNPAHLWLGTRPENQADMARKGRAAKGERHSSKTHPERIVRGDRHPSRLRPECLRRGSSRKDARLTETSVLEIRNRYAVGGVSQSQLAHEYGVTQATVFRAIHKVCWTHI